MQRPDGAVAYGGTYPASAAVAIAIHDVSPATWRECCELLALADHAGARSLSLLVIPHYHDRASVLDDRPFQRAMDARLARGDELVLHGMSHLDTAPPPRTLRGFVERRVLTRAEGEFAALDHTQAAARIDRGVALFAALGWPLHGFVPPAWLMGREARAALAQCAHPFSYMTVKQGIWRLPRWRFERTANLCYSPDSALRRMLSVGMIHRELARARRVPLLRISLHPQDARVRAVLRHWERLIGDALATRTPVTKHAWAARFRQPADGMPASGDEGCPDACRAPPAPARAAS
jgi:uncharacterized protein